MKGENTMQKKSLLSILLAASLALCSCGTELESSETIAEAEPEITEITAAATTTIETTTDTDTTTIQETTTAETTTIETTTTIPEPTEEDEGGVFDVDRGFFVTKVTIPASFIEKFQNTEDTNISSNDSIILDSVQNDDGSVTYTYKTSEYNKFRREALSDFESSYNEMFANRENCTLTAFYVDDTMENITVFVSSEEEYRSSLDVALLIGIPIAAELYSAIFDFPEETVVHFVDEQTGYEFDTKTFPEE